MTRMKHNSECTWALLKDTNNDPFDVQCLEAEYQNINIGIGEYLEHPSKLLAFYIGDQISWILRLWLDAHSKHPEKEEILSYANKLVKLRLCFISYLEKKDKKHAKKQQ